MSLFLLQVMPSQAQPNKAEAKSNFIFDDNKIILDKQSELSNDAVGGLFAGLLNMLPVEAVDLLKRAPSTNNELLTADVSGDVENYFAEIIAKVQILLVSKYSGENDDTGEQRANLNIGSAPKNINSPLQAQDFWTQAVQMMQKNAALQGTVENKANVEKIDSEKKDEIILEIIANELNQTSAAEISNILQQMEQLWQQPIYQTQMIGIAFKSFEAADLNEVIESFAAQTLNDDLLASVNSAEVSELTFNSSKINLSKIDAIRFEVAKSGYAIGSQTQKLAGLNGTDLKLESQIISDFSAATAPDLANIQSQNINDDGTTNAPDFMADINLGVSLETKDKNIALVRFQSEAAPPNATPFEQISIQIKKLHKAKKGEINLQLNPQDLGRVDISLKNDADNNMVVKVAAELFDTYELLKNDKASLERILHEAGIKMNDSSLQFSHQGKEQQKNEKNIGFAGGNTTNEPIIDKASEEIMQSSIINLTATMGINIKV
jgi:flagellar hook-length control protein FliK